MNRKLYHLSIQKQISGNGNVHRWFKGKNLPRYDCPVNHRIVYLNNNLYYLSVSKGKDKEGKPELQIVISKIKSDDVKEISNERRQIETVFRVFIISGLNI